MCRYSGDADAYWNTTRNMFYFIKSSSFPDEYYLEREETKTRQIATPRVKYWDEFYENYNPHIYFKLKGGRQQWRGMDMSGFGRRWLRL